MVLGGRECHPLDMPFAGWDDYRDALRSRNGVARSLVLLAITLVPGLIVSWIVLWLLGLDHRHVLVWVAGVATALVWTWMDAAHRHAARRLGSRH
jgi:hypothetical protein